MESIQETKERPQLSVSVVMCTYNGAAYVEEQLLSIVNQTFPLYEILIFDDASTDETVSIVQSIADRYPLIHFRVNEKNLGYTRNFEQALLSATGDAIAISDQDDIWLPTKIEELVRAWKPGVPLIYCYSYLFDKKVPEHPKLNSIFRRFEGTDARKLFMFNTVSGHAMVFRRSFLQLVLPFSEKVTYDWWMAVVASYNGGVQFLPKILVYQRKHGNNITVYADNQYTKQEIKAMFKQTIINNCTLFATAPNMPEAHRNVALRLVELTKRSLDKSFYRPLFLFIMKYRKLFFYYKKRKIDFFSHLKHSYRKTKN